ncbi:hypothetical protein AGROH133_03969 [Agrobacterium tumefaciens]|nr:hypothetical protein AGROH133_03969 [Agrobacterium tumefaciens]
MASFGRFFTRPCLKRVGLCKTGVKGKERLANQRCCLVPIELTIC